jgi:hypothetical protein
MLCEFENFEVQIYLEEIKTLLMEPLMFLFQMETIMPCPLF